MNESRAAQGITLGTGEKEERRKGWARSIPEPAGLLWQESDLISIFRLATRSRMCRSRTGLKCCI